MFMHGGIAHLFGNMLYLWIFGDNVEDALGHLKFLIFYLLCGVAAALAHILSGPNSLVPSLGASGAIAGVLGGYLLMFPSKRVRVLVGYMGIVEMPALVVIGIWGALQVFSGFSTPSAGGGVAYWAHIGGLVTGLLIVSLFRTARVNQRVEQRLNTPGQSPFGGPPRFT